MNPPCEREGTLPKDFIDRYQKAEERRAEILKKYEKGFDQEGGWVPKTANHNRRTTIADIEKRVGLENMRPSYTYASSLIHAGSDSIRWSEDPGKRESQEILFGPSTEGLASPGVLTATTVGNIHIRWMEINWTDNPFLSKDQYLKDIDDIRSNVEKTIKEFIQAETDSSYSVNH